MTWLRIAFRSAFRICLACFLLTAHDEEAAYDPEQDTEEDCMMTIGEDVDGICSNGSGQLQGTCPVLQMQPLTGSHSQSDGVVDVVALDVVQLAKMSALFVCIRSNDLNDTEGAGAVYVV